MHSDWSDIAFWAFSCHPEYEDLQMQNTIVVATTTSLSGLNFASLVSLHRPHIPLLLGTLSDLFPDVTKLCKAAPCQNQLTVVESQKSTSDLLVTCQL